MLMVRNLQNGFKFGIKILSKSLLSKYVIKFTSSWSWLKYLETKLTISTEKCVSYSYHYRDYSSSLDIKMIEQLYGQTYLIYIKQWHCVRLWIYVCDLTKVIHDRFVFSNTNKSIYTFTIKHRLLTNIKCVHQSSYELCYNNFHFIIFQGHSVAHLLKCPISEIKKKL